MVISESNSSLAGFVRPLTFLPIGTLHGPSTPLEILNAAAESANRGVARPLKDHPGNVSTNRSDHATNANAAVVAGAIEAHPRGGARRSAAAAGLSRRSSGIGADAMRVGR